METGPPNGPRSDVSGAKHPVNHRMHPFDVEKKDGRFGAGRGFRSCDGMP